MRLRQDVEWSRTSMDQKLTPWMSRSRPAQPELCA